MRRCVFLAAACGAVAAAAAVAAHTAVRPARPALVQVLCYHSFRGDPGVSTDFSEAEFAAHLERLGKEGFTFVSFRDVKNNRLRGDRNILLTFDDAHATVYDIYRRVLKPWGIKPLLAVYPCVVGRKKSAMTWAQLAELAGEGCSFAAHGYYHMYVDEKFCRKDPEGFLNEICGPKKALAEKLGLRVDTFVYPFGRYSPVTMETLGKEGYRYSFTIKPGAIRMPLHANPAPLELPRYMVTREAWPGILRALISNTDR